MEIALALAVASFCLITLIALLPLGLQHYQQADSQSAMVNLATMVARDLQATPDSGVSPRFQFSIPAAGGNPSGVVPQTLYVDESGVASGNVGSAPAAGSIYRISLFFSPPSSAGQKMATVARIWITFPAKADPTPTSAPSNYANMFETTVTLNRN